MMSEAFGPWRIVRRAVRGMACLALALAAAPAAASQVSLVSRADPGVASETASLGAELRDPSTRISADGRYAAHSSGLVDLVAGQSGTGIQVFL